VSIKTYRAKSVHEALSQVKKDLGSEAVILHTRTYKTGGILGIRASTITEITASSQIHVEPRLPRRKRQAVPDARASIRPSQAAPATSISDDFASRAAPVREPELVGVGSDGSQAIVEKTRPIPERFAPAHAKPSPSPAREVAQMMASPDGVGGAPVGFQDELAAIRKMVGRVLQNSAGSSQGVMPEALNRCYLRMIENEVTSELADEIIGLVRDELSPVELKDSEIVQNAVLRRIAAYIDRKSVV